MADQFISVRETAQLLGISEKKVLDLLEEKKLQGYRIANQFLRLKKSEVLTIKNSGDVAAEIVQFDYTTTERVNDFFYFNSFYLVTGFVTFGLLFAIFYF